MGYIAKKLAVGGNDATIFAAAQIFPHRPRVTKENTGLPAKQADEYPR